MSEEYGHRKFEMYVLIGKKGAVSLHQTVHLSGRVENEEFYHDRTRKHEFDTRSECPYNPEGYCHIGGRWIGEFPENIGEYLREFYVRRYGEEPF